MRHIAFAAAYLDPKLQSLNLLLNGLFVVVSFWWLKWWSATGVLTSTKS